MKMTFKKNIPNMSQGPSYPGFWSVIVENLDILKKDTLHTWSSQRLFHYCYIKRNYVDIKCHCLVSGNSNNCPEI